MDSAGLVYTMLSKTLCCFCAWMVQQRQVAIMFDCSGSFWAPTWYSILPRRPWSVDGTWGTILVEHLIWIRSSRSGGLGLGNQLKPQRKVLEPRSLESFFFFFPNYVFWLCQVLAVAHKIFIVACRIFHCGAQASL